MQIFGYAYINFCLLGQNFEIIAKDGDGCLTLVEVCLCHFGSVVSRGAFAWRGSGCSGESSSLHDESAHLSLGDLSRPISVVLFEALLELVIWNFTAFLACLRQSCHDKALGFFTIELATIVRIVLFPDPVHGIHNQLFNV